MFLDKAPDNGRHHKDRGEGHEPRRDPCRKPVSDEVRRQPKRTRRRDTAYQERHKTRDKETKGERSETRWNHAKTLTRGAQQFYRTHTQDTCAPTHAANAGKCRCPSADLPKAKQATPLPAFADFPGSAGEQWR